MVTIPDEVKDRVLSYIKHQAAKSAPALRDVVQHGHDQVMGMLAGMSDEQAVFKPSAEEWSVFEVLQHAAEAGRRTARGCVALAAGEELNKTVRAGQIKDEPFTSLDQARAALDAAHQELLNFVDSLSPKTNVEAMLDHPFFGPLNCREWAAFQRVHDGDHAGQIEQITSAAGYPA